MNRLTNKLENNSYDFACSYNTFMYNGGQEEIINKLGKLEDLMERYEIESIEELELIIEKKLDWSEENE